MTVGILWLGDLRSMDCSGLVDSNWGRTRCSAKRGVRFGGKRVDLLVSFIRSFGEYVGVSCTVPEVHASEIDARQPQYTTALFPQPHRDIPKEYNYK